MRFGHYTVFDTPEENKHTQVYVEYDVPNKDNLDGATGTIVLTESGEGSGGGSDEGHGIRSITISPSMTTTPALDSFMPINYNEDNSYPRIYVETAGAKPGDTISFIVTPTSGWKIGYVYDELPEYGEVGEPYTITAECTDYKEGGVVVGWDAENNVHAANADETEFFSITVHVSGNIQ